MKICTVVVTYNRYKLLTECMDALLNQSVKTDILIVDNFSTDGTEEKIKEENYLLNSNLIYKKLDSNRGGAGGFYFGVKYALEKKYDYVWLMDDDAEPELDAIEKLIPYLEKSSTYSAYAPATYIGTKEDNELSLFGHRGLFDYENPLPSFQKPLDKNFQNEITTEIEMASFVGIFIPISSVEKIGLPREDFFIHHDDTEYSLRLMRIGKILMVNNSIIYHKEQRQDEKYKSKFLWLKKNRIRFEKLWLKYYGLRNSIYIARKYSTNRWVNIKVISLYLTLVKDIILYDDNKLLRLKFASNSVWDGYKGHFDNSKAKKILKV